MVSGAFHIVSQEWRYFSREKAIVHTAHMGQLPPYVTGQSVFITPVPPTGTGQNNFGFHPQPYPGVTPYKGVNITDVFNNVAPLWAYGFSFDNIDGPYGTLPTPSGTNGMSGTFYWNGSNLREVEQDWWPSTGGTFLVLAKGSSTSNSFDLMDAIEMNLYNGTVTANFLHGGTPIAQGDYYVRLGGDGWFNQFFVAEGSVGEGIQVTSIMTINPNSNIGQYLHPSPFNDDGSAFGGYGSVIVRLGP